MNISIKKNTTVEYIFYTSIMLLAADIFGASLSFILPYDFFSNIRELLSWILFILTLLYLYFFTKSNFLVKLFLVITIFKWIYFIFFCEQYNFRKDIIVAILLALIAMSEPKFKELSSIFYQRWINWIFVVILFSFLPFIDQPVIIGEGYRTGDGMYRINGLWDNSKKPALYFFFIMLNINNPSVYILIILWALIALAGARSVLIASSLYVIYPILIYCKSVITKVQIHKLLLTFVSILTILIIANNGYFFKIENSIVSNIKPLIENDIKEEGYGNSRKILNMILLKDMKSFSFYEIFIGRSATAVENVFEINFNARNWPHNDMLMTLYVHGVIGFILYFYYLYLCPFVFARNRWSGFFLFLAILLISMTAGLTSYSSHIMLIHAYSKLVKFNVNTKQGFNV